jgi:hypothetical protein
MRISSVWLASLASLVFAAFPEASLATPQIIVPFEPTEAAARSSGAPAGSSGIAVRLNAAELQSLPPESAIELTLPNGARQQYVLELTQANSDGTISFFARHARPGTRYRAIVTHGPGGAFAVFDTPQGQFRLVPGGTHDWLVDAATLPPEPVSGNDAIVPPRSLMERAPAPQARSADTFVAVPGVNALVTSAALPTPQATIDIMFVVTSGLADNLGADLNTRMNFLVARANAAYADSEIAITLRLVRIVTVDYPDTNSASAALDDITPVAGGFDAAHFGAIEDIRAAAGADMVALMLDGFDFGGGGVAWLSNEDPYAPFMYSVTKGCVRGCEAVAIHEFGHNMGNQHDRHTTAWQAGGVAADDVPPGAFSYSFGYAYCHNGTLSCNPNLAPASGGCAAASQPQCSDASDDNNFRDIMAYFQTSTDLIYKFSNPLVDCVAEFGDQVPRACGVDELAVDSANTALSMNNMREGISALFPEGGTGDPVGECSEGPLPVVCPLPDVNGDGTPDLAAVRAGATRAEVRSGANGTLIRTLSFLNDDYTPAGAAVVPDTDADGVAELAVLAVRDSDSRLIVQMRDLDGSGTARSVFFATGHTPIAIALVREDADDNGTPELAVLSTRNTDDRGVIEVKNANGVANTRTLWAPAGYAPLDVESVPDADGNAVPDIALLASRISDGRNLVQVRNADGSGSPYSTFFALNQTAIDLAVLPDKETDGIPEVAVLSSNNIDGRLLVELKNASGAANHFPFWLGAGYTGLGLAAVTPADGNSKPEIAILRQRQSDGRILVSVRNASGADTLRSIFYTVGYTGRGLAMFQDVDDNDIDEAAVLMTRNSDGRILVQSRNTLGTPAPVSYFFEP